MYNKGPCRIGEEIEETTPRGQKRKRKPCITEGHYHCVRWCVFKIPKWSPWMNRAYDIETQREIRTWMLVCHRMNVLPKHIRLMVCEHIAPKGHEYEQLVEEH